MLASPFNDSLKGDPDGKNIPGKSLFVRQQQLLELIGNLSADYASGDHTRYQVERLLQQMMELTNSQYGFAGEISKKDNIPFLHTMATINLAPQFNWNFTAPLQAVVSGEQPVILADSGTTRSFLGLPVVHKQTVVAVIGLGGNQEGYTPDTIAFFQPLLQVLGHLHTHARSTAEAMEWQNRWRQLEEDREAMMNTLDDIVFVLNDRKVFTHVWCTQEHLLFRPKEEILGKTIAEALGEHAHGFNQLADKLLRTGEEQLFVYPDIRQSPQNWYQLKMRLIKSIYPTPKRMLLLIRNISESEKKNNGYLQAQADLRRSNQLLSICLQMGKMGGWEFNVDTGEMYWTKEMYELREVSHDFSVSLDASLKFYHPDDISVLHTAREHLFNDKIPYDLELRHISAKGKRTWMRTVGRPEYNADGQLTHFRGILMDITDKKDAELALMNARDAAQKAAQARSEFLSVMSHEIRTPLNAIIGIAGLMNEDPAPGQMEMIRNLDFSSHHLLGLINNILDFSKMEAGRIELENIRFNITHLLRGITGNHKPLADSKGVQLLLEADKQLPSVLLGDPYRLSQILNNLLDNAIKFTIEGSVCLQVRVSSISDSECTLAFSVEDTGIGIASDMQDKIFDTFIQEDAATTRHHGGTGLGLTIARKLVELHKSQIRLDSRKNTGTTFYFDICFRLPETDTSHIHQSDKQIDGLLNDMKLLIVEDNAINIRILELQLRKSGATITTATNGRQALEKMQQQDFDGIIMDLHMPEMNGYETIPHIRNLQPKAFIIILTADIMPDVSERLSSLGITEILPKPYAAEDLLKILKRKKL